MKNSVVGYVYSGDGLYGLDRVEITLLAGREVYRGEYLCVDHPPIPDKPVFLQVESAVIRRPSVAYEEKLVRDGIVRSDPEKISHKAVAWQIGYDDGGIVRPLLTPIPPLTPVYRPEPIDLERFLTAGGPSITVGTMYPFQIPVRLSLKPIFRQGALVVGGVGTGKSTLLLSMMISILRSLNGLARILLVDWDGEYNSEELRRVAEDSGGYARITASNLSSSPFGERLSPNGHRVLKCSKCGLEGDRDVIAVKNLLQRKIHVPSSTVQGESPPMTRGGRT